MAIFLVGQRVRVVHIKYSDVWEWRAGVEGVIVEIATFCKKFPKHKMDCIVQVENGVLGYPMFWQLEPVYDGHQTVSWESMKDLWTPQQLEHA
jgi:hypothetical protein